MDSSRHQRLEADKQNPDMPADKVKEFFARAGKRIIKWRWAVIAAVVLLTFVLGSGLSRIQMDTSNESWFLADDPIAIATEDFKDIFGNDDTIAILVEADDVFSPEVLHMIRDLGRELERKVPYAGQLTSLTDLEFIRGTADGLSIEQIVPEEIPENPQAIEAMRAKAFSKEFFINRIFSADSTEAWILLRMQRYPDKAETYPELAAAQAVAEILAQDKYHSDDFALHSTGMPVVNLEKRQYMTVEAQRTMGLAILLSMVILGIFLRSVRGVIVPMVSAICSIVWVFGAMGFLGVKVDPFMMTVPVYLGLAVSIGYSIHLFNFFERALRAGHTRHEAIIDALQNAGWPIFFTALTTIGSMLSFCLVPVHQIRWVGCTTAAGVMVIYLVVITLTPALLSFGRSRPRKSKERSHQRTDRFFTSLADWIMGHAAPVMTVFCLLAVFLFVGATQVRVDMDWQKTSGVKVPFLARQAHIAESPIGALYSYDLIISFDDEGHAKKAQALQNLDILADEMAQQPMVKRVNSILDIVKDMNQALHENDPAYYRVPEDDAALSQLLFFYELSGGENAETWVDYDYANLRLSVEIDDYKSAEVERQLNAAKTRAAELFPDAHTEMVGTMAQYSVVSSYVARGEIISFLLALCVIGIAMMVAFKSVKIGLVGMIPNLSPALVVAGLMGYLDIPLDMITMTIIPMLLGLAVDDTIHFIAHVREGLAAGLEYEESIRATFRSVGRALLMTSLILVCSFSVYLTSDHLMFFHLGGLIGLGVSAALLADYFVTPILLRWACRHMMADRELESIPATDKEVYYENVG